jgi:hypothetical protein
MIYIPQVTTIFFLLISTLLDKIDFDYFSKECVYQMIETMLPKANYNPSIKPYNL